MERDLFLQFEYRNKLPILFNLGIKTGSISMNYNNISRKADVDVLIDEFDPIKTDVTIVYLKSISQLSTRSLQATKP
jgi:hypothetical protein